MRKVFCVLLISFVTYFCVADSLRLKSGELLKGKLISFSSQEIQFSIENDLIFKFKVNDIDSLLLSTSNAVIQLIKKDSTLSAYELIGMTSESLYLRDSQKLFCLDIKQNANITFSLQNKNNDVAFYDSQIENLTPQELWNRILIASNSKSIIDWIDFSQFDLEANEVLFYEEVWNVLKEYIPQKHHNFLWELMENYTKTEKNIMSFTNKNEFPLTQKRLREDFLYRIYRLLGKINN
jgi:hypothetical protein